MSQEKTPNRTRDGGGGRGDVRDRHGDGEDCDRRGSGSGRNNRGGESGHIN